jgi:acetoin utilization deacetylase AcuC-like enzyme
MEPIFRNFLQLAPFFFTRMKDRHREKEPRMRTTGLIHSEGYLLHDPGDHPEQPERYSVILDRLRAETDLWTGLAQIPPSAVERVDLLRCHAEQSLLQIERAAQQATVYPQIPLDGDTLLSAGSNEAAHLAAGGACRAIDAVMSGTVENAFVACRPPGHHARPTTAMGFCLYNNVAVAARYAQATYPDRIRRILIVDFDVHHGNGTQEIFEDDPTVFFFSLHQYPWYPGTGAAYERGRGPGEGTTLNIPLPAGTTGKDYLPQFERGLSRALATFTPDLLLVSAGFDAHESDPLGSLLLTDETYRQLTDLLLQAARQTAEGRLVSCLEGGYNLTTLGETVRTHLHQLMRGPG